MGFVDDKKNIEYPQPYLLIKLLIWIQNGHNAS